jgi:hypothetical protein
MKRLFRTADRRLVGAAVVSGLLLVPLGVFGSSALAHGRPSGAQYQYKVTICHHTHSKHHPWVMITISNRAFAAHLLRHHDQLPPCPTMVVPTGHHHGHGHDSGDDDDQGTTTTSMTVTVTTSQMPSNSHGHDSGDDGGGHGHNGHHGHS